MDWIFKAVLAAATVLVVMAVARRSGRRSGPGWMVPCSASEPLSGVECDLKNAGFLLSGLNRVDFGLAGTDTWLALPAICCRLCKTGLWHFKLMGRADPSLQSPRQLNAG